ncbi:DNA primase [Candidatus Curtissbacteria bacterium]|nr:DNA primase [Candidatus Curtissbacteria bacterium]
MDPSFTKVSSVAKAMADRSAGRQVDEVKSKVDLVEVISAYLPLKKAGRNYAGLCPFHTEKTPSFMVSPDRQVWKCFGCGENGDVFTFLEKIEGWEFRETLQELAKKAGVKLAAFRPTDRDRDRDKLFAVNSLAEKFYSHLLNKHPAGEVARKYLAKRGIPQTLWEKFGLGYAPSGWDNTLNFFAKRGFNLADLATAGLVIARSTSGARTWPGGGFYDRFRERLIFPLKDSRGSVLGFSGRTLRPFDSAQDSGQVREPKYINSPETPIFNKGSLLFGLDVTRKAIRDKNEAILVEGEFDVLSAYKAGLENVVASKGTALTQKQAVILSRVAESVVVCFDTDLAGDAAARRGIELLDISGVGIKVVRLGNYKDPDEFAQSDPAGFKEAVGSSANVYDYFIESASARYDGRTSLGKKKIGQEILPIISKISDDLVKAHYISQLAKVLDLETSLVAAAVEKKQSNLYSMLSPESKSDSSNKTNILNLEEYFLALFVFQDEATFSFLKLVEPSDFGSEEAADFWKWVRDIIKDSKLKSKSLKRLLIGLPKNLSGFVDNLYLVNISPAFADKELCAQELVKTARRIKQESCKRRLSAISKKIKLAQSKKDEAQLSVLSKQFDVISKNLKELI